MNDPIRAALVELIRLYDWRNELGRIERDFNHDKKQMTTWLNQYGREKKAAWDVARKVVAVPEEGALELLREAHEVLAEVHKMDPDEPCHVYDLWERIGKALTHMNGDRS